MNTTVDKQVFDLLVRAASGKKRCPTNQAIASQISKPEGRVAAGTVPGILKRLTGSGQIVVRVYAYNWRVVTICAGAHAGKTTMPSPHKGEPYLIVDTTGRTMTTKRQRLASL